MRALLVFIILLVAVPAVASAQTIDGRDPLVPVRRDRFGRPLPKTPEERAQEEMLLRATIRRGEESHREMVERARENAQLGSDLQSVANERTTLAPEDVKKLERMESLARKIRGESGGSDDDETVANPPRDLASALKLLSETSDDLLKKVEKTSRLVASYAVVRRSNEVIQLVRHVKTLARR